MVWEKSMGGLEIADICFFNLSIVFASLLSVAGFYK